MRVNWDWRYDAFMKLCVSSSRCESCPAKGEPARAGSQPCGGARNDPGDARARRTCGPWGMRPETYNLPGCPGSVLPEGNNNPLQAFLGEEGGIRRVFDHGTYEEDGPVTWEALASPRHIPA